MGQICGLVCVIVHLQIQLTFVNIAYAVFDHSFFSFCSSMNEVVHTSPTIGSNVEEIVVNNTRFLMWDIGGQESLRSSWNTYYTNTEVRVYSLLEDMFL